MTAILATLLAFLLGSLSLQAQEKFYNYYDKGLKFVEKADWVRAVGEFRSAISLEFEEKHKKRTYGTRFIEYYPHRELGIAHYHLGEYAAAKAELELSIAYKKSARAEEYLKKIQSGGQVAAVDEKTLAEIQRLEEEEKALRAQQAEKEKQAKLDAEKLRKEREEALRKKQEDDKKSDLERQRIAAEQARLKMEGELKAKQALEFRQKEEQERQKRDKERLVKEEQEKARQEAELKRLEEEARKKQKEEEQRKLREEQERIRKEQERQKRESEERRKKEEEERRRAEQERLKQEELEKQRIKAEQEKLRLDQERLAKEADEKKKQEEEFRRREEESRKKQEEEQKRLEEQRAKIEKERARLAVQRQKEAKAGIAVGQLNYDADRIIRVGSRLSLAILPFENIGGSSDLPRSAADKLITQLVNLRRFRVIERTELDKVMQEQDFRMSDAVDSKDAAVVGKVAGADVIVIGTVKMETGYARVSARLVDVETGETVVAREVQSQNATLEAIDRSIEALSVLIYNDLPIFEGYIVNIEGDKVYLDIGTERGVRKGTKCVAFKEGDAIVHPVTKEVLGKKVTKLGELVITSVQPKLSEAKFIEKEGEKIEVASKVVIK